MNSQLSLAVAQSRQQELHRAAAEARHAAALASATTRSRRFRSLLGIFKPAPAQPVQARPAHIRTA